MGRLKSFLPIDGAADAARTGAHGADDSGRRDRRGGGVGDRAGGDAAAGSFHSSMETLAGGYTLEIVAVGGVPDSVVAMLATQPVPLNYSARIEDYATVVESKETLPLIGIDMIAEGSRYAAS